MSKEQLTDGQWRDLARDQWAEIDLTIDQDAVVSEAEVNRAKGAWVQAWVWVDHPQEDEE